MTSSSIRVDFYVLPDTAPDARLRFTCRLTEKVYDQKQRAYTHMTSAAEARQLDELIWTFRAGSFLPHEIMTPGRDADASTPLPVTIGHGEQFDSGCDVLINLTDEIPPFFDQFQRVVEIIDGTAECRRLGRERFSVYRDSGCEPNTHTIS